MSAANPPRRLLTTDRFFVEELWRQSPDGTMRKRAIIRHTGAVAILPIVDGGQVCLIRNYRVAAGGTLLEIPAGTLVPGEDPLAAAQRELAEETGFRAERWQRLFRFYMSPGILDEQMHLFVATGLTAGQPAREPGEEIENVIVGRDEAHRMVEQGQIVDAKTLIAILWWTSRESDD